MYAANTDNFFVLNDRDVVSRTVKVLLVGPETDPLREPGVMEVAAPTDRGVVFFRTLIESDGDMAKRVREQKTASCRPMGRGGGRGQSQEPTGN